MNILPEKVGAALTAETEARYWYAKLMRWQDRKIAEDQRRAASILEAWGVRVGKA